MPLVLDAYNILHTTGVLPPELAGIDLRGLIKLIQHSRYRRDHVTIVCDGKPPSAPAVGRVGGVVIRYSGASREADDVIRQFVRRSSAPRRLTVVSSDQAILKAARKRRCSVLSSAAFLHHLAQDAQAAHAGRASEKHSTQKPQGGLTERQVRAWLAVFGVDPEMASEPRDNPNESAVTEKTDPGGEPAAKPQRKQRAGRDVIPPSILREAEALVTRYNAQHNNVDTDERPAQDDRP